MLSRIYAKKSRTLTNQIARMITVALESLSYENMFAVQEHLRTHPLYRTVVDSSSSTYSRLLAETLQRHMRQVIIYIHLPVLVSKGDR
jgi:hypothetical protein